MRKTIAESPMEYSLEEVMEEFGRGKLDQMGLIDYLKANEEASLEYFRSFFITDVKGIYKAIEVQRDIWKNVQQDGRVHSGPYFDRLLSMLDDLQDQIENSYLMEELPPWWTYSIVVDTSGIALCMDYYDDKEYRAILSFQTAEDLQFPPDQTYTLIKVESKLLKVEEYAAIFGVDSSAVRAWIRRGKLPAAIKYGREWRIPELCDVGGRSYVQREYYWEERLDDLPEEYEYLNDYSRVILRRDYNDRKKYEIVLIGDMRTPRVKQAMSIKEREHLEMLLISHPSVTLYSPPFAYITMRHGQGVYLEPFDGSDDNTELKK